MSIFEVADVVHLPPVFIPNPSPRMRVDSRSQGKRAGYQSMKVICPVFVLFRYNKPFVPIVPHNVGEHLQGIGTGIIAISVYFCSVKGQSQKEVERIAVC